MQFYELYIKDTDGLYKEIPVSVVQHKDYNSAFPNQKTNAKYVRRFYIIDNQIGLQEGYQYPSVIRYAASIKIQIKMDKSKKQQIFIPTVRINYKEKVMNPETGALESPMA